MWSGSGPGTPGPEPGWAHFSVKHGEHSNPLARAQAAFCPRCPEVDLLLATLQHFPVPSQTSRGRSAPHSDPSRTLSQSFQRPRGARLGADSSQATLLALPAVLLPLRVLAAFLHPRLIFQPLSCGSALRLHSSGAQPVPFQLPSGSYHLPFAHDHPIRASRHRLPSSGVEGAARPMRT